MLLPRASRIPRSATSATRAARSSSTTATPPLLADAQPHASPGRDAPRVDASRSRASRGAAVLTMGVNLDYPTGPPDAMEVALDGGEWERGAAARLVVHRGVRRTDVEPAALRRRRGRRRSSRRSTTRSRRWRWSRRATSRAPRRHADPRVARRWTRQRLSAAMIDAHQHFWRYDAAEYGWIDDSHGARCGATSCRDDLAPRDGGRRRRRRASPCRRGRRSRRRAGCSSSPTRIRSSPAWSAGSICRRRRRARAARARGRAIRSSSASGTSCRTSRTIASCCGRRSAAGIALLEEFGLAYDILIYRAPAAGRDRVRRARFPRQRFVLDHLGEAGHPRAARSRDWAARSRARSRRCRTSGASCRAW